MTDERPRDFNPDDDGYLCDRVGDPAEDIRRWEVLLGEFRKAVSIPPPPATALRRSGVRVRSLVPLAMAATLLLAAGVAVWYATRRPDWVLEVVTGAPRIDGPQGGASALTVGSGVTTDASSRARIRVGSIGWVDVASSSSVRILAPREDEFRMAVDRGTVRAQISAAPGRFVVDMPHATAIDLGCVYTLRVSESGDAVLTVESGWVQLESADREALVPEGAEASSRRGSGAGSPYYRDASLTFRQALSLVDFGSAAEKDVALDVVLAEARPRDALTLLTLLGRVDAAQRIRVHDRLRELLPPPADVTRSGIGGGDRAMIDRWWTALRLNIPKKKPVSLGSD